MDYKNYQRARDLVWRILLEEGVRALPIEVFAFYGHAPLTKLLQPHLHLLKIESIKSVRLS